MENAVALKFFWRFEGTTLDGVLDRTDGDSTANLINGATLDASAARVGSSGLIAPGSQAGGATFSITSGIYPGTPASPGDGRGAVAILVNHRTSIYGTTLGNSRAVRFRNAAATHELCFAYSGATNEENITLRFQGPGGTKHITTTGGALTEVDTWYAMIFRFDYANDYGRVELRTPFGQLLDAADSAGDLSTYIPSDIDLLNVGSHGSGAANAEWFDNIIICTDPLDPIERYLLIEKAADYGQPDRAQPALYHRLRAA